MSTTSKPYQNILISVTTYSAILNLATSQDRSYSSVRTKIKLISAAHSIFALCLAVVSLSQEWPVTQQKKTSSLTHESLDDTQNPLISGTNTLANFVTAWEAGYLIYDTAALCLESAVKQETRKPRAILRGLLRDSPVSLLHHVCLASALLYLQTYVAKKREKGLQVIMAFFLMNASTPLLHLRWWRKKMTGRGNFGIDLALAGLFAISRFGSVLWVVQRYGHYHRLGPWSALKRQRSICQVGTGLLTGVNAIWWAALVAQIVKSRKTKGS